MQEVRVNDTGRIPGKICFVDFPSAEKVAAAYGILKRPQYSARLVKVDWNRVTNGRAQDCTCETVFVTRLPLSISEGEVKSLFMRYGMVADVKLGVDLCRQQPGAAFVRFIDAFGANNAVRMMNGSRPVGFQIPIKVERGTRQRCPHRGIASSQLSEDVLEEKKPEVIERGFKSCDGNDNGRTYGLKLREMNDRMERDSGRFGRLREEQYEPGATRLREQKVESDFGRVGAAARFHERDLALPDCDRDRDRDRDRRRERRTASCSRSSSPEGIRRSDVRKRDFNDDKVTDALLMSVVRALIGR